jgi:type IV secretion system protein TrbC
LSSSLTGSVAYSISLIAIVVCGLAMAFTDLQGGAKRFIQAACGLSIAFFSVQIVTSFLGFSGALV